MTIAIATGGMDQATIQAMDAQNEMVYAAHLTTNASGVYTGSIPDPNLVISVQSKTPGEFANNISIVGTTITVTFKKFRTGGLGLNLGTLLSVSIFEDSPGIVQFDLKGCSPT